MKRTALFCTVLLCLSLLVGCRAPAATITPAASVPAEEQLEPWDAESFSLVKAKVPELLYPGSLTDPQEAMEKLQPAPQTETCPVCGGTNLAVVLVSTEVRESDECEVVACIHNVEGQDDDHAILMQVQDVCQSCADAANPWKSDPYEVQIGTKIYCHGW